MEKSLKPSHFVSLRLNCLKFLEKPKRTVEDACPYKSYLESFVIVLLRQTIILYLRTVEDACPYGIYLKSFVIVLLRQTVIECFT